MEAKEFFTTSECLNHEKSSQQLPSCIVCRRHEGLSVLQNVFAMCWAREDFEKLFEETVCN